MRLSYSRPRLTSLERGATECHHGGLLRPILREHHSMPDFDATPTPGRPAARGPGRVPAPEEGDRLEGLDPPTVRSAPIVSASIGSASGGSASGGSSGRRPSTRRPDVPPLPVAGE